jgi:hypothetical protein
MTREEMIAAIRALKECKASEPEMLRLVKVLDQAAPGSRITDMIYHPDKPRTPEEIVDAALPRVGTWDDD